jgi:signal transduction histidine kinase/ligand-binding sensor domain-containing protein
MHRPFAALVLIAMALGAVAPVAGQRLPVRTLTTADGLPRDQLECVRSDGRGFVWFCTDEGLVRYDGHVAVTFGRDEGLNPARIRSFLPASGERYFVGADGALFTYGPSSGNGAVRFTAIRRMDGRSTRGVNALTESADHSIWCATGGGLLHLSYTANGYELAEVDIGLPTRSENDLIVHAVREDEQRVLWIGATTGLYARYPDGHVIRMTTANGLPADDVLNVAIDGGGRLWVATRHGLALIDREAVQRRRERVVRRVYTERDGLPLSNIRAMHALGRALWIATVGGVVETTPGEREELRIGRQVTGFIGWDVTSDLRGDIWVATEAGARRIAREGFTIYSRADGLPTNGGSSLFETTNGHVCATGTLDNLNLSCFGDRRFTPVPVAATRALQDRGWGWSQITLQDRKGGWWIPTGEGLLRFAPGPMASLAQARPVATYTRRDGLRSSNIFRLFEDSHDGIWVATYAEGANGLARIDLTTGKLRVFGPNEGFADDLPFVYALAEDRAGAIWIGFNEGRLFRYRGRFEEIPMRRVAAGTRPPSYEAASDLLVDRSGRLWIANTDQGLGRIDEPDATAPVITWYGTAQGLSSNTAWVIVEDSSGDLFVGTGRGVDRFDPKTSRFTHYSADEGVPRGEIQGALRDSRGRIWLASTGGVARFEPGGERRQLRPQTLITGIRVGGVSRPVRIDGARRIDAFTVARGDRRIEIEFVTPGVRAADGLRYQHRLEGVDPEWTTTDARVVALAGAAPGPYRFLVRSILADGYETEPATVDFVVPTPVWRRAWFIGLVALAVFALVLSVHRIRVRQLIALDRVRSQIAADLHDSVGANLSRIAVLSDVVKQQARATLPGAMPALDAIGDNARAVIDDMSDAVWFIDPRLDDLQQVVARVRALSSELFDGHEIRWALEAPEDASNMPLTSEQRRHLYMMLKESLTNVVRHARATRVSIRFATSNGTLRIEVTDDGVGLAAHDGAAAASRLGGRGLQNLQQRAAALAGSVRIASNAVENGTSVILEVPMAAPHVRAVGSA